MSTDPSQAIAAVAAAAAHQNANDVQDAAHHIAVAESLAHQQQQQHYQQQYQQYQQAAQHETDLSTVNDVTQDMTGGLQQVPNAGGSLLLKANVPSVANKCRRCKKKRPDDEPMETARYRTCKPCREIERKKKRVKKANLRGEVLHDYDQITSQQIPSHHLPQQSLQHHIATNADVERDLIQIANQVSNSSGLHSQIQQYLPQDQQQQLQQQQYQQQQQQQYQQQQQQDDKEIPIDDSLLRQGVEDDGTQLNSHDDSKKDLASDANAEAIHAHAISGVTDPSLTEDGKEQEISTHASGAEEERRCLYCNEVRTINDNGRYQLCENCIDNPLRRDNVFNDFESYTQKIFKNRTEDLRNVIFISKFQPSDGIITDFNPNHPNLDPIITDLNERFINPLISKSGYKFSKGSSNLAAKPYPKTIKLLFKCKQDIKTVQKQNNTTTSNNNPTRKMKTENCHSNVYISYDLFGKNLSIKFNHLAHLTFLEKTYSRRLIDKVSAWMMAQHNKEQLSGGNSQEETQEQVTERLLYKVFNQLKDATRADLDDNDALIVEVGALKKINFIKDFLNA